MTSTLKRITAPLATAMEIGVAARAGDYREGN